MPIFCSICKAEHVCAKPHAPVASATLERIALDELTKIVRNESLEPYDRIAAAEALLTHARSMLGGC